ncbi:MAG: 3-deoxy-D-manno-octulosonic acid transferase, partial [Phycisphaerales bacterium]
FVLDAIGHLRKAYALAEVVVPGRSFGDLYGSDPMEPAALGKPLLIGPRYGDFADSVRALDDAGALLVVEPDALGEHLGALLDDADRRSTMAQAAIRCVRAHQGSTARHVELLLDLLPERTRAHLPAQAATA